MAPGRIIVSGWSLGRPPKARSKISSWNPLLAVVSPVAVVQCEYEAQVSVGPAIAIWPLKQKIDPATIPFPFGLHHLRDSTFVPLQTLLGGNGVGIDILHRLLISLSTWLDGAAITVDFFRSTFPFSTIFPLPSSKHL